MLLILEYVAQICGDFMKTLVTSNPDTLGGTPVFAGTRVPVAVLFENLADGLSLDEILDSYPSLSREQALEALKRAEASLESGLAPG